MVEGQEITTITVALTESITFKTPVQIVDVICYGGTLYVNWRGKATVNGINCLKMPEKSSYTIRAEKPFTTLNIAGDGEIGVIVI